MRPQTRSVRIALAARAIATTQMNRRINVLFAALLVTVVNAQSGTDLIVADYYKVRDRELAEAGQRHLKLGSWARDAGLVPQATSQFLRAVEVGQGHNPGAQTVLGIMRGLGDAFWSRRREHPPKALLADFARRSDGVEARTRKAHADLARRALRAHLDDACREHWLTVLRLGGELDVDAKGQWRLDGQRVPDDLADWLQQQTAEVAGKPVYEIAGTAAPKLEHMIEQKSDQLVVRTDLSIEPAQQLHALGSALWPLLQARLDGAPTRQLRLFVFQKRADYEHYLDARQLGQHKAGRGLADYAAFQTLVCAEGLADADLQAIVLHELSHLFFYGTAPAVMPDWYAEGFAEQFGGQGTFRWDGTTLEVGGLMRRDRIVDLQEHPIPLAELIAGDAAQLLASSPDQGHRFYAECWALHRFLLDPHCKWNARFVHFEQKCRDQVLGAPQVALGKAPGMPNGSAMPASAVFQQLFGEDLAQVDAAFQAWLATL